MRTINLNALNFWVATNGPLAKEHLASKACIKFHSLKRILEGTRMPTELEQTAICQATGLDKDTLFPVVENKKNVS
jgi:hypothetical protein